MVLTELQTYLFTLLIEVPVITALCYRWGLTLQQGFLSGLLIITLVHPLTWQLVRIAAVIFSTGDYLAWFMGIESVLWLTKAVLFKFILRLPWTKSLWLALIANTTSALIAVMFW